MFTPETLSHFLTHYRANEFFIFLIQLESFFLIKTAPRKLNEDLSICSYIVMYMYFNEHLKMHMLIDVSFTLILKIKKCVRKIT